MIVVGETGLCRWMCSSGAIAPGEVDAFVAHLRSTRPRPGLVLIDIAHDITAPSSAERRAIAEAVRDVLVPSRDIAGHAVVSNSAVARGVMTAISWVAKTPFPEATFGSPTQGLAWAAEQSPAIDVVAVLAEMRQRVPGFAALRW